MSDAVIICENYQGCRAIALEYGRTFWYSLRREDQALRESKLGKDLLAVAGVAMIADRAFRRRFRLGEFTRTYHIQASVNLPERWEEAKDDLIQALSFLSSDNWSFTFRERGKESEAPLGKRSSRQKKTDVATILEGRPASVALFSGGLDSFCGAASLLDEQNKAQNDCYPIFLSSYMQGLSRLQELLERLFHKAYLFSIDAEVNPIISGLNHKKIFDGLGSEFDRNKHSLSRNAIARKDSSHSWIIRDSKQGYTLKKEKGGDRLNIYSNLYLHVPIYFRASSKKIVVDGRPLSALPERTRRTRSFFYLAQAAAFALAHKIPKIYLFENGVLALNLPVRADRTGARSTRHAHPFFLEKMGSFLRKLSPDLEAWSPKIENPFALSTKAEILQYGSQWPKLIKETVSCWGYPNFTVTLRKEIKVLGLSTRVYNYLDRAGIAKVGEILEKLAEGDAELLAIKGFGPKSLAEVKGKLQAKGFVPGEDWKDVTHCGFCLPCLVRRLALKGAGVDDLQEIYAYDVFENAEKGFPPPEKREGQWAEAKALFQFARELEKLDKWEFYRRYTDNLVHLDPIDHDGKLDDTYEMMKRFAKDVIEYLGESDE